MRPILSRIIIVRLVGGILAFSLIAFGLVAFDKASSLRQQAYQQDLTALRQTADRIGADFYQPVNENHGLRLTELLAALALPPEIMRTDLVDAQGLIVASWSAAATQSTEVQPVSEALSLAVPVRGLQACLFCHTDDVIAEGYLKLVKSRTSVAAEYRTLWVSGAVSLTAGLILPILLLTGRWWLRRPLRQLADRMGRVAEGDFTVQLDSTRLPEIAHLAQRFNQMVDDLSRLEKDVEQGHFRQMEQMDRLASVGEMAAGIAHEIRNPLAGIGGAITVLADDLGKEDPRQPILQEVQQQIQRLDKTVTDLLYYARPGEPELVPCEINELVRKTLFFVSQHPEARQLNRVEELTPGLPDIWADPKQVQQMLFNVLLNAVQVMPEGGVVRVATSALDDQVTIRVSDSGPGIPAENRDKIFNPFYTTKVRGTGLGLSICRRLAEQQGGRIYIEDRSGGGTTVVIELPTEKPSIDEVKDSL